MTTTLVDSGWSREIARILREEADEIRIVSPFIKVGALSRLLSAGSRVVRVITRFRLVDFAEGVSDIAALRKLLEGGSEVRGIRNLHAKMYLFGSRTAIVTSANLTAAALDRNHEFGLVSDDNNIIAPCRQYFERLWTRGGANLTAARLDEWDEIVTRYRAEGGRSPNSSNRLGDFGADAGIIDVAPPDLPVLIADASQAFVKFLGEGHNRVPLSSTTIEEINRAGCHWAVGYPASKRPRGVTDDAVIFIARLTEDPNDMRVFGRAVGMGYVPGRDDATPEDIARRSWKATWSRYIRVHHAEFVAGTMANGISLNELMDFLGTSSFASTKRNAVRGQGNIDPRKAYQQQAAVELSAEGMSWLSERLQAAFDRHGKVPRDELDKLDWPTIP